MSNFFWLLFSAGFILVFGLLEVLLLRLLNRDWWRITLIRRLAIALPLVGVATVLLGGIGAYNGWTLMTVIGVALAMFAFILEIALMLSLPVSGAIHLMNRLLDVASRRLRKTREEPAVDHKRRAVLKGVAAAVPLITVGTAVAGVARAYGAANIPVRKLPIAGLADDLVGLKVLHLSDLHLRHFVTLDDLESVLMEAAPHRPDLVLVTGDIADDLEQLPQALAMIDQMRTPLGAFASLGNHEYFRGVQRVRRLFDRSPIPLLVNQGQRVAVGDSSLFVGGIDDPRTMGVDHSSFYRAAVDRTLHEMASDDLVLLMSHRPEAFDHAADRNVAVTLAGHTHGGQIGLLGRSLLQQFRPNGYHWGHYHRGDHQLHVTSGVGHWFPFRLGCPPEAPVLVLERA